METPSASPAPSPVLSRSAGTSELSSEQVQQLLQQHHRLKAQNAVLKKGVLQEQQKTKDLEDQLKTKEQALREALERDDLLEFNNQRLTKRVTTLQDELKAKQETKSGWFGSKGELNKLREQLSVTKNELEVKIKENEQMHIRVFEVKQEHEQTLSTLEQKMNRLKASATRAQEELQQAEEHYTALAQEAKEENEKLKEALNEIETNSSLEQQLAKEREESLERHNEKQLIELQCAKEVLIQKVLFNDTAHSDVNIWNVPHYNHTKMTSIIERQKESLDVFQQLLGSIETHHSALRESLLAANRAPSLAEPLKIANNHVAETLPGYYKLLLALMSSCKRLISTRNSLSSKESSPLDELLVTFSELISFNKVVLTGHQARLTEQIQAAPSNRDSLSRVSVSYELIHTSLENLQKRLVELQKGNSFNSSNSVFSVNSLQSLLQDYYAICNSYKGLADNIELAFTEEQHANSGFFEPRDVSERVLSTLRTVDDFFIRLGYQFQFIFKLFSSPETPVRGATVTSMDNAFFSAPLASKVSGYLQRVNAIPISVSIPYNDAILALDRVKELEETKTHLEKSISTLERELLSHQKKGDSLSSRVTSLQEAYANKHMECDLISTELAQVKKSFEQAKEAGNQATSETVLLPDDLLSPLPTSYDNSDSIPPNNQQTSSVTVKTEDLLCLDDIQYVPSPAVPNKLHSECRNTLTLLELDTPNTSFPADRSLSASALQISCCSRSVDSLLDNSSPPPPPSPNLRAETPLVGQQEVPQLDKNDRSYSITVLDENGIPVKSLGLLPEDRERESELCKYYDQKLSQYSSQAQLSDSKALRLVEELQITSTTLREAELQKEILTEQLESMSNQLADSVDELETTKYSYEQQLQLLSEHIATLNDKVTSLDEEITRMHEYKVLCAAKNCKYWNTIGWLTSPEGKQGQLCQKANHNPQSFKV